MPFGNPLVSGQGELIREQIQSPGYVAGVSGWRIGRDGSAEFNDVTARGTVYIVAPDGSYIKLYEGTGGPSAAIGTYIEVHPPDTPATVFESAWMETTSVDNGGANDTGNLALVGPVPAGAGLLGARVVLTGTSDGIGGGFTSMQLITDEGISLFAPAGIYFDNDISAPNVTGPSAPFVPTWAGTGAFAAGNSVVLGDAWRCGNFDQYLVTVTIGAAGFNAGAGSWVFGGHTPRVDGQISSNRPVGTWWLVKNASTNRATGTILTSGAAGVSCQVGGGTPTVAAFSAAGGAGVPTVWAAGDLLVLTYRIPVA